MFIFYLRRSHCKYVALIEDESRTRLCLWVTILLHMTMLLLLSWLGTSVNKNCIAELVPSRYGMKHVPRPLVEREMVWLCYTSLLYHSAFSAPVLLANYTNIEQMGCVVWLSCIDPHRQRIIARPSLTILYQWFTFLAGYTIHNNEI